jgi:protein-disulfide isomerase
MTWLKRVDQVAGPVLMVCALVVTSLVVYKQFAISGIAEVPEPTEAVEGRALDSAVALGPTALILGNARAHTRIVEFADFQCPYCARSAKEIHALLAAHPNDLAVEFRHLPIAGHPMARPAANAAECAAHQGSFSGMYEVLYAKQAALGKRSWHQLAQDAHIPDLKAFDACMLKRPFDDHIEHDLAASRALHIRATPSWIVADSVFGGAPPLTQMEQWVRSLALHVSAGT